MAKADVSFLYIEDDALSRRVIEILLTNVMGFSKVTLFENSANLLERIGALPITPDVVFLDVQMPRLNGLEVCEAICSAPAQPLIIFVTAYDEHALKAFELHAIDYLLKYKEMP